MIDSVFQNADAGRDLRKARRNGKPIRPAAPTDRLPPHSEEMERGALGCVLLSPKEALTCVAQRCKGNVKAFYDLRHQVILTVMLELQDAAQPIDVLTLHQRLKDGGQLEQVGGIPYLNSLQDAVPSAANVSYYMDIVFEKWLLRRMMQACSEAVAKIYDYEGEVAQLMDELQRDILSLPSPNEEGPRPIKAYSERLNQRLDTYARGIGTITGLPTGYRYLDRLSGGMHPGDIIIIGGDPGAGKTSLAMNIAERVAMDGGNFVGVISLEMSAEDLILRLACSRARVNFHKLRTGCPTQRELEKLVALFPKVINASIILDDAGGLTMHEVRSRLRGMVHRYGIRLAIVDYLQLISLTKEQMFLGAASGYADVARGLQQAAKELQIPIIVLSQLSNEGRKRKKREIPKLTDFRETGAIGDVANLAGILWRPELEPEEEEALRDRIKADPMGDHTLELQMEVLKNKNGPSGTSVGFEFMRWCMRFEDLKVKSHEDLPDQPAPATEQTLPTNEELGFPPQPEATEENE